MDIEIARARLISINSLRGEGGLRDALIENLNNVVKQTAGGTAITSTSANGISITRAQSGNLNPSDELKIAQYLIMLYDEIAALGVDENEIYKEMLFQMQPVERFYFDHSIIQ